MASRTKRKRYRRQMEAKASAGPKTAGGWGQGSPIRPSDFLLVRQAIREGWDVPAHIRQAVVDDVMAIARDKAADPRLQIAAVRAVLAMQAANMAQLLAEG